MKKNKRDIADDFNKVLLKGLSTPDENPAVRKATLKAATDYLLSTHTLLAQRQDRELALIASGGPFLMTPQDRAVLRKNDLKTENPLRTIFTLGANYRHNAPIKQKLRQDEDRQLVKAQAAYYATINAAKNK